MVRGGACFKRHERHFTARFSLWTMLRVCDAFLETVNNAVGCATVKKLTVQGSLLIVGTSGGSCLGHNMFRSHK